ncbi:Tetratricopeptide TPR_1 repeat-containing protein [Niastella koreensis GR20-10]|uniref:Tetratricopeptide TPR_1 repeat-containing protein n=2 Tax=Niastella koreensis TaxID=354356 RepID=G8TAY1_NIAKG|nr:tetratricopeptide repeat protein [Niastella koreensis]AEW00324.1 Tetratricopeptide TPR_1 repeat-containing protein [Niastella koreensis GR20-10]
MRILPCILVIMIVQAGHAAAQSPVPDKNKVMDFFQNMQYEEAISYLLTIEKIDSVNLQTLGYLGYAYQQNDDQNNAGKYYQKMLDVDSTHASANLYFSDFYSDDEPAKARRYMSRLITGNPQKAGFYKKMGDLFRRENKKDSAIVYYEQAYRLLPTDSKNGAALADLLIDQKNYDRADSIIGAGLLRDSVSVPYLKLQVKSFYDAAAYQKAVIPGEQLMRLGEGSLNTLTQVVLSYYIMNMYRDCIRVCDYMVAHEMAGENVLYYEAKSYAKLREFDKSNELLKTCLGLAISNTAEYYFHAMGDNYGEMKQFKKAIAHYDTAYYLFKDPLMLYDCGRIQDQYLKNDEAAKKYYSKYLLFAKPQSPDEKKAYEYLRKKYLKEK